MRTALALLLALLAGGPCARGQAAAVAASLYPCVTVLAERYQRAGGKPPALVVGSSGRLARQIEAGAPFGLFLSADLEWLRYLQERGLAKGIEPLVASPLVLWWDRSERPSPEALSGGVRVALADPATAPFGGAARRYLEGRGLYRRLERERKLVITADVLQAGLAAASGGADLALISASVARRLGRGASTVLAAPALVEGGCLVPGRETAGLLAFWDYLRSADAAPVWREWGFAPEAAP